MQNLRIEYTNTKCTDNNYYFVVMCDNNKVWFISETLRKSENYIKKIQK